MGLGALIQLFRLAETRRQLLRMAALLLAVRVAVHLPLFPGIPDATPAFQKNPYLALLDIFSGGAMARGSVLSLGIYPLWLARPFAFLSPELRRGAWGEMERRRFQKTWFQIAVLLSLALGWIYPAFLSRVTGAAIATPGLWPALTLTAGTALSLWFAQMLDGDETTTALKLLAAFHVLAALPRYFFEGCSTSAEMVKRGLLAAVLVAVYGILSQGIRRIPLAYAPRVGQKLYGNAEPYLPLRLNLTRMAPLLWVLVGFGFLRWFSLALAHSQAGGIRGWAGAGLLLTSLSAPEGWLAFFLVGFLAKWAVNLTSLSGVELQGQLLAMSASIPGVKPWRDTARLIDRTFGRLAWIEPLATVGMIAATALWVEHSWPGSLWPVLLVPVLFTVLPLWELAVSWEAQLVLRNYAGFMKRGRL